jgi:type IX secretion system PorP/SprF family membrane protein
MRLFLVIIGILITSIGYGQHFPIYSQYLLNGLVINPAYTGSRDVLSSSIMYRQQWIGFEGAPKTLTLSAHTPLKNRKIGIGLHLVKEQIGITNNLSFFGNYAYRVRLGQGRLSFGFKFGAEILSNDYTRISTESSSDIAFSNKESFILPNFGVGTYYFTDQYFIGFSVPSLLSYRRSKDTYKFEPYNDLNNNNYLLTGGCLFWITNNFKLKPSTLIRYYPQSPVQYDLNLNAILFKDGLLWLGASYRSKEALVALAEVQMGNKWRLGVSYDYSLGDIKTFTSGSVEVLLRMELITVVKTINPRFF